MVFIAHSMADTWLLAYFALSLNEVQGVCSPPERSRQIRPLQPKLHHDDSSEPSAHIHHLELQYPKLRTVALLPPRQYHVIQKQDLSYMQ